MPAHPIINRRSVPWGKRVGAQLFPAVLAECQERARDLRLSQASMIDAAVQRFLQLSDDEIYQFMLTTKHLTPDEFEALQKK